jgi:hypothetical protein
MLIWTWSKGLLGRDQRSGVGAPGVAAQAFKASSARSTAAVPLARLLALGEKPVLPWVAARASATLTAFTSFVKG